MPVTQQHRANEMQLTARTKMLLRLSMAVLVSAAIVAGVFFRRGSHRSTLAPITLRYVKPGSVQQNGRPTDGPAFLVTNHTDKTLFVRCSDIEVPAGSAWVNYSTLLPYGLLVFYPNSPTIRVEIKPHEAAYVRTVRFPQPTTGPWRLKVSVDEELEGLAGFWTHLTMIPGLVKAHQSNTNVAVNPFRRSAWGNRTYAVSDRIDD